METQKTFKVFHYRTQLRWTEKRQGTLGSPEKPDLAVAAPPEFKGPVGVWTPEELFVAAVDVCTMTTFLAFADYKKLPLIRYESAAEGTLENVDGKYRFTRIDLQPRITVASAEHIPIAEQILRDAKASCLISNSINTAVELNPEIVAETT